MDEDDDYNPCGEEYEHDLHLLGEGDGYKTWECRNCGAEIDEGPED